MQNEINQTEVIMRITKTSKTICLNLFSIYNCSFILLKGLTYLPETTASNLYLLDFTIFLPLYRKVRKAGSVYVCHESFAFEPDFWLKQYSTLKSGCLP